MLVTIGVDPHKGSHTAVAIDGEETKLGEVRVSSAKDQCDQLLGWAEAFPERRFAIESAAGLGHLLAQQLLAAGEEVLDVPPTLAARVRVLGSGKAAKNDPNDALSTAIAALRQRRLRRVSGDDQVAILRMLADRHHDLAALRTHAVCRLHATSATLSAGGLSGRLSVPRATALLRSIRSTDSAANTVAIVSSSMKPGPCIPRCRLRAVAKMGADAPRTAPPNVLVGRPDHRSNRLAWAPLHNGG